MADMKHLIKAVRDHALANYTNGGWDYIVECWSDDEILEEINRKGAITPNEAIKAVGWVASLLAERRADVRGWIDAA